MAVELAQGYISLIPSMNGAKAALASQLTPAATTAGTTAGAAMGASMGASARGSLMKFLGPAAIVAGVVVAFKGLYSIGEIFDEVSDTIRVGTGATGEALDGLVASAKNVGREVPAEWSKVGEVVADLNTRLGLSGGVLETVAAQYLEAGRILGTDVDIKATTKAFSAFGIEGAAVEGGMDSLFRVAQATGVGINELATGVGTAAPYVKNLGFGFLETASLIGGFDKAGLDAKKMLGPLGAGLAKMAKTGEQPAEVFPRVIADLEGLIEKGDVAGAIDLAGGIFGTRGAAQFVNAVQSGALNLDDLVGSIGATEDTILGAGAETMDFAETWQLVKNNAQAALEPLGSSVFSALGDALKSALPTFNSFAAWLTDNQWVLGAVAVVIGGTLVAAFVAWTASIWAATFALLANPITWIVLAIVGLIAIVVLLVRNWDSVTAAISKGWDWIKAAFQTGVKAVTDWLGKAWDFIKLVWSYSPLGLIVTNWDKITGAFATGWDTVRGWLQSIWDFIVKVWSYSPLGLIVTNWDKILDFFKGLPKKVGDVFARVGDAIKNAFKAAFNFVAGLWNKSIGSLTFDIPDWVPGIGGNSFGFPKIPLLASGGHIATSGWAMVGEQGPELLRLPRGATVVPLAADTNHGPTADDPLARGVTFVNYGNARDTEALAKLLARSVQDKLAVFQLQGAL